MENENLEFAVYGRKNSCTRNDTAFPPLSEISKVEVSVHLALIMAEVRKWYFPEGQTNGRIQRLKPSTGDSKRPAYGTLPSR